MSLWPGLGLLGLSAMLGAQGARGRCYQNALRLLKDMADRAGDIGTKSVQLVHGSVFVPDLGKHIRHHAWVETEDMIFDPEIGLELDKEDAREKGIFYRPEMKYTAEEAYVLALRTGHYGPWHK